MEKLENAHFKVYLPHAIPVKVQGIVLGLQAIAAEGDCPGTADHWD